jgi:hypothetical protein
MPSDTDRALSLAAMMPDRGAWRQGLHGDGAPAASE